MSEKNMKNRKIHLIQVTVLTAICFFIMTPVFAEGASISLDPAKLSVSKNEEFTLLVNVNPLLNLFAYQFDIKYNPKNYEIVSVEEGSFLNNNGADNTFFLGPLNGSRKDIIAFASTRMGSIGGVDGTGTLVEITFMAKKAGKVRVSIVKKSVDLLDSDGQIVQ